jgi:hypothetical protein
MSGNHEQPNYSKVFGIIIFCAFFSFLACALVLGIIPSNEFSFYAARWVVIISGMIFVFFGLMILFQGSRCENLFASIISFLLACVFCWASLFSYANDIEGMTFVSEATKIFIARLMFAAAGVLCLFSAANFLRFLKPVSRPEKALPARRSLQ